MPDFIVIKDGFAEFVEVKFRTKITRDHKEEFSDIHETWPEAMILFVTKSEPHFQIAKIGDFIEMDFLFPLSKFKFLRVDDELINKYSKQVIASYGV